LTPLFVDSAYVIALINERDRYHVQAKRLARLYRDRALIISEGVLLEIGNALAGRFRLKAAQVIEQMLGSSQVEVVYTSPRLLTLAIALYKQMDDKQWGLVDCISFVITRERGVTEALTSDHHFVQAGFRVLFSTQG
jgi:predicted nucleic acid-binding protein